MIPKRFRENRLVYDDHDQRAHSPYDIPDNISVTSRQYVNVQEAAADAINRYGLQIPARLIRKLTKTSPDYEQGLARIVGYILHLKNKGHIRKLLQLIGARHIHDMFDSAKNQEDYHKQCIVALLDRGDRVAGWDDMKQAWKYVKNSETVGCAMSDVFALVEPSITSFCGEQQVAPPNSRDHPTETVTRHEEHGMEGVDVNYLASVICPQRYSARAPDSQDPIATALLPGRNTYTVNTNAAGNALVTFIPSSIVGSNIIAYNNDVTYSPTTGSQTPVSVLIPGPQSANGSTIRQYRITKFCTYINDTLPSLTAQGMVSSGVYYQMPNPSFGNLSAMSVPVQDINMSKDGVVNGIHNLQYARRTILPLTQALQELIQLNGANLSIVYCLQGLSANTPVTFTMQYALEYIPVSSMSGVINTQYPKLAPATFSTMGALQMLLQGALSKLTFKEASKLAQLIIRGTPRMSQVIGRIRTFRRSAVSNSNGSNSSVGSWKDVAQHAATTALDVIPHLLPLVAGDSSYYQQIGSFLTQIPSQIQPICVNVPPTDQQSCYYDSLCYLKTVSPTNTRFSYADGTLDVNGETSVTPVSIDYVLKTSPYPVYYYARSSRTLQCVKQGQGNWAILVSCGHAVPMLRSAQVVGAIENLDASMSPAQVAKAVKNYTVDDRNAAVEALLRFNPKTIARLMKDKTLAPQFRQTLLTDVIRRGKKKVVMVDEYDKKRLNRDHKGDIEASKIRALKNGQIMIIKKTNAGYENLSLIQFANYVGDELYQEQRWDHVSSVSQRSRSEDQRKYKKEKPKKSHKEKSDGGSIRVVFKKGKDIKPYVDYLKKIDKLPAWADKTTMLTKDYGINLTKADADALQRIQPIGSVKAQHVFTFSSTSRKQRGAFMAKLRKQLSPFDGPLLKCRNLDGKAVYGKKTGGRLFWFDGKVRDQPLQFQEEKLVVQARPESRVHIKIEDDGDVVNDDDLDG